MAVIRRSPGLFGGLGVLVIVLVFGWLLWPHPQASSAEQGYLALDAVTAGRIEVLRADAGLDDDALAALDLTPAQLESALAALRSGYEANSSTWIARWSALADQRARVRLLESAINRGQDESSALAAARQGLAQLEAEYQSAVAGLRTTALASASEPQQLLAQRMAAQRAVPMPLRVLELSAGQQTELSAASCRYHQRLALARTSEARALIESEYHQQLESILGTPAMQTLTGLGERLGPASERVVAALRTVLPIGGEG